jgi:hypothetical protein
VKERRLVEQAAPGAEDEPDPVVGGRPDKAAVDDLRLVGAARHRGDQQWRLERPAEHHGAQIDLGQVAARQRPVAQPDAVEPGSLPVLNVIRGGDAQMVRLAPRGHCSGMLHADRTEETTDRTNGMSRADEEPAHEGSPPSAVTAVRPPCPPRPAGHGL